MARLTAARRNALPASAFAGPNRTYPVPDTSHAIFAKAMATKNAGPALKSRIDSGVASRFPALGKKKKSGLAGQLTGMRQAGAFGSRTRSQVPRGGY